MKLFLFIQSISMQAKNAGMDILDVCVKALTYGTGGMLSSHSA